MSRTRDLIACSAVCLCLAQWLGCKIEPPANVYSCKGGEACPSGQSCGADDICRPTRCAGAEDCPSGYECREWVCTPPLGESQRMDGGRDAMTDTGPGEPETCDNDARRCAGNVPEQCVEGTWRQSEPCGGATPACTNGECATLRLYGSIVTIPDTQAVPGKVRLVEQGLEYTQPSCGNVQGRRVCLSGGIVP